MIDRDYVKTKLLLFIARDYLDRVIKEENASFDGKLRKIYYGLRNFAVLHKFSKEEATALKNMDDSGLKNITDESVSYIIFTLELVRLWAKDHPTFSHNFGVNHKTLTNATSIYTIDMLMLKQRDILTYDKTKEIFEDSKATARKFYVELFYNIKL